LYNFIVHVEIAYMSLLPEDMLILRGQAHVQKILGVIFESGHIRLSFAKTIFHARAMAPRCTEEDTAVLLKYIIETLFFMRGSGFVSEVRKRVTIGISQQGKSLGLRPSLAATASHGGHTQNTKAAEAAGDDQQEEEEEEEEAEEEEEGEVEEKEGKGTFPPQHFNDLGDISSSLQRWSDL
jgi:hypothetical protein